MAAAALWLVLCCVLQVVTSIVVPTLFGVAPLIAATGAGVRRTVTFAGVAVALAIGAGWRHGLLGNQAYWARVAAECVIGAMAVVVAGMCRRREERLAPAYRR